MHSLPPVAAAAAGLMRPAARIALLCAVLIAGPARAQVVPDRGTATTVATSTAGRITVRIAPAGPGGLSRNTYSDFSVPRAGLGLDNRGVDATTIVNEVSSARRSVLRGPVEVLGSRANVVLANPNGITIDGGRFVNTGGVALSGGRAGFRPGAGGGVDTILSGGSGDIRVTGGGLSGAMTSLQLVAGRIRIDGPVVNAHVGPKADIALASGRTEVILDSGMSPLTSLQPWARRRDLAAAAASPAGAADAEGVLVDVTPRGSLSASRVQIAVGGRGAGVSYAGRGQAAIGDFSISAGGRVTTRGAVLRAERGLKVTGASVAVLNDARRGGSLTSTARGVTLVARSGDILLHGTVTGVERTEDDRHSAGGVTLRAARDIRLFSEGADRLAIAFSSKDDLVAEAGGGIANDAGRLLSNATTVLRAAGTLANGIAPGAPSTETTLTARRYPGLLGSLFGLKRRVTATAVTWSGTRIPGEIGTLAGEAIDIRAGRLENRGEIDALDGSLAIDAGTVVNAASPIGAMRLAKTCGVTCWSRGSSTAATSGGRINATGSAAITAAASVENSGDIVAYGNLSVTAPLVSARALVVPDIANRPAGFYDAFAGPTALVALTPAGGGFSAPAGTVTLLTSEPVQIAGGTVSGGVATEIPAGTDPGATLRAAFPGGLHSIGVLRGWLD